MKVKSFKKYAIITSLILGIFTGCIMKNDASFKAEDRGKSMKKYLHYCTYEISDEFREYITYKFFLRKSDVGGAYVWLEVLPKTDKIDKLIDLDITKHKLTLREREEYKYFGEVHKKNIKVGDYPAVFVSYEFNTSSVKGESDFNQFLEIREYCYITLKDKTVRIKMENGAKYFKPIRHEVEEFYKSYKPDQSQAVKTNYGSFKWVPGLEDQSTIEYYAYNAKNIPIYSIKISYPDDEEKNEINKIISSTTGVINVIGAVLNVSTTKDETLLVNGYKIKYDEIFATGGNIKGKMADIRIFDFNPGIYIKAGDEIPGNFEMYRSHLDAMIQSIKFYPDLKKD
jgi:hypothetical protein